MSIILWIITALLQSLGSIFSKKALNNSNISNWLFILFWPIIWLIVVYIPVLIQGTNLSIFNSSWMMLLLIIAWIFDWTSEKIKVNVLKKVKISYILPYDNLDKLFIIIFWFIFFFGNEWYTSLVTFFIAILTFIVTLILSIDFKKIKLDKNILLYIWAKIIKAISVIIVWLVLLEYTTLELFSFFVLVLLLFYIITNLIVRNDFKTLFTQSKLFYKYRIGWTLLWWTWFFLWFLIIEKTGVIIASLISFISIVFSIISMKIFLWDKPNKKQILSAFLITLLIWIWYYFK